MTKDIIFAVIIVFIKKKYNDTYFTIQKKSLQDFIDIIAVALKLFYMKSINYVLLI